MQQHSSVPEKNLQLGANPEKMVADSTKALADQDLHLQLWLERCLNQLQNRINNCLIEITTKQPNQDLQAEILQLFVDEMSMALENCPLALGFSQQNECDACGGLRLRTLTPQTSNKIAYVSQQQQLQNEAVIKLATGKSINWQLAEVISLQDIEYLQNQKPQAAWQVNDEHGVVYWLIAALGEKERLKAELKSQLIERSLSAVLLAITQIRYLEAASSKYQQLESQNQELRQTNQLKSEFLANASHEIRTPLSSILGFTHLLQAQGYQLDNLRHQEYLNIILTSGQHLLALINDILDLSKIEANQLEVQNELINVSALCQNVIALVKEKANEKGLQLRLELDPHATTLVADPLRLKQMLFNLLSNALKFTRQGTVGLQVKHQGAFIRFTVWDTGTGIAKEEQAQLFQPYSQIANVVAGRQEGTGLGLALTKKLAELHGGWIEVKSEVNCGSQFTIVIPLTAAVGKREQIESKNSACYLPVYPHQPKTPILLVEDNYHNAKLITTYLKKLGYQVTWAKDAAQMWEALKESPPEMILMDINLPDVDGLTLVRQLRAHKQYQKIPVVAQTAMAMKGDRETCIAAGAVDYISKPLDLKVLAELVSKYSNARAI